jgi:thiol-disulfide isomerase/thioredoxin
VIRPLVRRSAGPHAIHPHGMPSPTRSTQLLVLVLGALVFAGCKKREPGPPGDIVATLTANQLDGTPFDPATLRGKPGLVMFVSPTCPHCIEELPVAQKVAREKNANIVAVFIVGRAENAKTVVENTKFEAPALIDDGTLKQRYEIRTVPYTIVVNAQGKATEVLRGAHGASRLAEALDDAR